MRQCLLLCTICSMKGLYRVSSSSCFVYYDTQAQNQRLRSAIKGWHQESFIKQGYIIGECHAFALAWSLFESLHRSNIYQSSPCYIASYDVYLPHLLNALPLAYCHKHRYSATCFHHHFVVHWSPLIEAPTSSSEFYSVGSRALAVFPVFCCT